jgi:transposase
VGGARQSPLRAGPGEQAQVDFGQLLVWIADVATAVHFFVFTLGFSRRAVA